MKLILFKGNSGAFEKRDVYIKINNLLDADSDVTLISLTIADKLNPDSIKQNLVIRNAVLNTKPIDSKLVTFKTYSDSQLNQCTLRNTWVLLGLNAKYQKVQPRSPKIKF